MRKIIQIMKSENGRATAALCNDGTVWGIGESDSWTPLFPPIPQPKKIIINNTEKVEWVVNSAAELGVKVDGVYYFLYKGESLVYNNDLGKEVENLMVRTVGKREFGECCHPINYDNPELIGTVNIDDCDRWVKLPLGASK